MPTRGYRKGVSDDKQPLPRQIYARFSETEYLALGVEAGYRSMTVSALLRSIVHAHVTSTRAVLPHDRGPRLSALRDLARIGNNLNQLARQANTGIVTVSEVDLLSCLTEVNAAARRLG